MAEQENGSSPLAEALARVGDRGAGRAADCPALLGAAAPGRLPADRRGHRARRGAAPAGALGSQARRPGGSPPAPRVRHPSRGPLVLPDLRRSHNIRSPGSAPAPVPAQLKQVVHASADEVDVRVVESGDHAMPERVDHARTRPDQNSNVALIAHGGDAASGHGERGGLRPGGIPGRDPAVAEDEISRSRHARARRSRCGYGCAGGGGGHFSVNFMRRFARVPAWLLTGDVRRPTAG